MLVAALAIGAGGHMPAGAEPFPSPRQVAEPDEVAVADEVTSLVLHGAGSPAQQLQRLDHLLARLRRPTPLRGLVQYIRASALLSLSRQQGVDEAIDESIRLLPGYSGPLLLGFHVAAYSDRAAQAAEYLLRASRIDPEAVRRLSDFDIDNLMRRLDQANSRRHRRQVAERLFEVGWLGESLALRSALAVHLIQARLEAGDQGAAEALLPRLLSPLDARRLLMQNQYRAIWPRLEIWAGPQQRNLWPSYLAELQARWRSSRDPAQAMLYARALEQANHYQTLARDMLPLFTAPIDAEEDYDLIWVASPLADSLARLSRWDEIDPMFDRALAVWPSGSDINAINLAGNRARFRLVRGDAASALAGLDAVIAEAERSQGGASAAALTVMHYNRVCALRELARESDALQSIAFVAQYGSPIVAASMYLCLDRHDVARGVLLAALERDEPREAVLEFMQPDASPPMQSEFGRRMTSRWAALRADPALLAAVSRYGRILPEPASAGAPPEQGPATS